MGVSIATGNSNLPGACREIYNNFLSPATKATIDGYAKQIETMAAPTISFLSAPFTPEYYEDACNAVLSWMEQNENISTSSNYVTPGTSGKSGFTADTLFSFELDHIIDVNETQLFVVSDRSTIGLSFYSAANIHSFFPELDAHPELTERNGRVYELIFSNGLKYVCVTHSNSDTRSFGYNAPVTYQSQVYTHTNTPESFKIDSFYLSVQPNISLFRKPNLTGTGTRWGFYSTLNDHLYDYGEKNGKYGLIDQYTGIPFQDKLFDSYYELVLWLCSEADLAVTIGNVSNQDNVDEVSPPASVPITGNRTQAQQAAQDRINSAANTDAGTIDLNIPTTADALDVAVANPAIVTDPAAVATATVIPAKPADLPDVDTAPALWQNKFPFCLPWDLYRLFSGFTAESDIPVFNFVIMPKDSFGLHLSDDIVLTIDFSDYNNVVQIVRCFIFIFYVYGMILITRKIIGAEG